MNRLSYRSAATLGIVCLGVRAFFAAYIDSPELLGAGWLGVLAGGAFSLPTLAALYAIARLYPHAKPEEALAACMGPAAAENCAGATSDEHAL